MTRAELDALPAGSILRVRLGPGSPEVRARYVSHYSEGRGRGAQTYVRVRVGTREQLIRVSLRRILGALPSWQA